MKDIYNDLELINNQAEQRFEMQVGDQLAFIEYKQKATSIVLIHTEVTPDLEGQGVATAIIEKTLHYLEENNLKLIPYCPLVGAYIKKHTEWKKLLDDRIKDF